MKSILVILLGCLIFNAEPAHAQSATALLSGGAGYLPSAVQDCAQIARDFAHNWTSSDQTVTIFQTIPCGNHNYYIVRPQNGSFITVRDSNLFFGDSNPNPYPNPYPQPQRTAILSNGAEYLPGAVQDCVQITRDFAHNWTSSDQTVTVFQTVPCGAHTYYVVRLQNGSLITVRDSNLLVGDNYPNPYPQPQRTAILSNGAGYLPSVVPDCVQIVRDFAHNWTSSEQTVTVLQTIPCGDHNYYIVRQQNGSLITVRDSNLFFVDNNPYPQPNPSCVITVGIDRNSANTWTVTTRFGQRVGVFFNQRDAVNFAQTDPRCRQ